MPIIRYCAACCIDQVILVVVDFHIEYTGNLLKTQRASLDVYRTLRAIKSGHISRYLIISYCIKRIINEISVTVSETKVELMVRAGLSRASLAEI
jgi:hypothetical protein